MGIGNPVIKFTELLRGAAPRNLVFPCNDQSEGPFWLENGTVIEYKSGQTSDATLRVVELGQGKFRLAENPCFEDLTTLNGGDEFYASELRSTKNTLDQLRLVILKIRHFNISDRPRH